MRRFSWDTLHDFGVRLLAAKGAPADVAEQLASIAVETEAYGISTHGVAMFAYFDSIIGQDIDPAKRPVMVKSKAASALIDGNHAFGQLAMTLAINTAEKLARDAGASFVSVRNSYWIGALSVYIIPLARRGLLVEARAQSSQCKDCAPFGGIDARFSTNPIAMAFPTGGDPVVADFSTAYLSMGKVGQLKRAGKFTESPAFRDKNGNLTGDPNVMSDGGTILFTGGAEQGYKGFAMSLFTEALTAAAGGSCNHPDRPQRQAIHLRVIDPNAFGGNEYYRDEMARFIAHVKSSRTLPDTDAIRLPGERAFKTYARCHADGIPLDDFMIDKLQSIAEKNDIPGIA